VVFAATTMVFMMFFVSRVTVFVTFMVVFMVLMVFVTLIMVSWLTMRLGLNLMVEYKVWPNQWMVMVGWLGWSMMETMGGTQC
jgi:hypothetical protein